MSPSWTQFEHQQVAQNHEQTRGEQLIERVDVGRETRDQADHRVAIDDAPSAGRKPLAPPIPLLLRFARSRERRFPCPSAPERPTNREYFRSPVVPQDFGP